MYDSLNTGAIVDDEPVLSILSAGQELKTQSLDSIDWNSLCR